MAIDPRIPTRGSVVEFRLFHFLCFVLLFVCLLVCLLLLFCDKKKLLVLGAFIVYVSFLSRVSVRSAPREHPPTAVSWRDEIGQVR